MALELGWNDWTVGFTVGLEQAPRQVSVCARALPGLLAQIAHVKRRFDLPAEAPVHSVYAAGRDGFWLHRFLLTYGVQNVVVEAASLEGNRRYRRSKTDKLDGQKLLTMLVRFVLGETRLWKVSGCRRRRTRSCGSPNGHCWRSRRSARSPFIGCKGSWPAWGWTR